jgi:hypothetical protein
MYIHPTSLEAIRYNCYGAKTGSTRYYQSAKCRQFQLPENELLKRARTAG